MPSFFIYNLETNSSPLFNGVLKAILMRATTGSTPSSCSFAKLTPTDEKVVVKSTVETVCVVNGRLSDSELFDQIFAPYLQ